MVGQLPSWLLPKKLTPYLSSSLQVPVEQRRVQADQPGGVPWEDEGETGTHLHHVCPQPARGEIFSLRGAVAEEGIRGPLPCWASRWVLHTGNWFRLHLIKFLFNLVFFLACLKHGQNSLWCGEWGITQKLCCSFRLHPHIPSYHALNFVWGKHWTCVLKCTCTGYSCVYRIISPAQWNVYSVCILQLIFKQQRFFEEAYRDASCLLLSLLTLVCVLFHPAIPTYSCIF